MYRKMFLICKSIQYRFIALSILITALILDTLYVTEYLNFLLAAILILFNVFIIYHQFTGKKYDRTIEDMRNDADIDSDEEFDELLSDCEKIDMLTYVSDDYLFDFKNCKAFWLDDVKSVDKSHKAHESSTHSGKSIKNVFTLTITDKYDSKYKLSFQNGYRCEIAYNKIMRIDGEVDKSQFSDDIKAEKSQIFGLIISAVLFLAVIIFLKSKM